MVLISAVYGFLKYLTDWPLALLLFGGGLYFTIKTGLPQLRLFWESIHVVMEKPATEGAVSSFGALMISTASRVGTGNIVGVSTALCMGGPGAVFWMWVTAVLGGASAFVESTLAQVYKKRAPDGTSYGGPAYYIEAALGCRPLAVVFSLALIGCYAVGYNMLCSYNLQSSFARFSFYQASPTASRVLIGGIIALAFLYCILGGGKRVVQVTGILVPVMGVFYVLMAVAAMVLNVGRLPHMFAMIFSDAFNLKAIFGGFAGSCLMYGFKRGLYSNEAGMGSAPNAAAAADVSHPAKQGLVQMLSVFIDTLLLCTSTAFMCLSSGVDPVADPAYAGAPYVQDALSQTFGAAGPIFITAALLLFAFTTLLGNFYYVETCFAYLLGRVPPKIFLTVVRAAGAVLIFLGALIQFGLAWDLADIFQCVLAVINIPVCILLGSLAYKALDNYVEQRDRGQNPVFKIAGYGSKVPTDFWN